MAGCAKLPATGVGAAQAVTLFLVCRVRLYHDAILGQLNRQPGVAAVGATGIGRDVLPLIEATAPDVVLLDAGFPDALLLATRVVRASRNFACSGSALRRTRRMCSLARKQGCGDMSPVPPPSPILRGRRAESLRASRFVQPPWPTSYSTTSAARRSTVRGSR